MTAGDKPGRVYGGRSSADREAARRQSLLDGAIDTLITGEPLTVRGVCHTTGLTSRYFYENFASTDALAEAAYDACVSTIATEVAAAFAAPPTVEEQISSAMSSLVDALEADPRAGHILFSTRIANALIARKRQESTQFFVGITAATAREAAAEPVPGIVLDHAAQFVVGGVTQLLSTWLNARYDAQFGAAGDEPPDADRDAGGNGENHDYDGDAEPAAPEFDGPTVARTASALITALARQLAVDLTL